MATTVNVYGFEIGFSSCVIERGKKCWRSIRAHGPSGEKPSSKEVLAAWREETDSGRAEHEDWRILSS